MDLTQLIEKLSLFFDSPWKQSLAILATSFLAAFLFDQIITRVIRRMTKKTRSDIDDRIVDGLHRPIFVSVLLGGTYLAIERLGIHNLYERMIAQLLATIAIVVWTTVLIRVTRAVLELLSRHEHRFTLVDRGTMALFDNVGKVAFISGGFYLVLLAWKIDVTGWLASAGILGLAVGFAAKDTIANLFAGVFILADKPYVLGDYINLDTGDRGEVTEIGLRTTRLLTRDDVEITIPNAVIGQAKIINENGGPWPKSRIRVPIGVAYGSDLDQVMRILHELADEHEEVCKSPEPRVRFRRFGDSSLDFELLCWIDEPVLRGRILHEINLRLYKAFEDEGVHIPFPQRDLHLHTTEPSS